MRNRLYILILLMCADRSALATTIYAFHSSGDQFESVVEMVRMYLGEDYKVIDYPLSKESTFDEFRTAVRSSKVEYALLLDNTAVEFAKRYKVEMGNPFKAVATMSLNLRKELESQDHICGIAFEPPVLRVVTQYQLQTKRKIRRLFVAYRAEFIDTVEAARTQLAREGIELNAVRTTESPSNQQLSEILEEGLVGNDAIWVLPDNIMINKSNFQSVWLKLARSAQKPFLCSIKGFAAESLNFCTFASFPNPTELAAQTGAMLQNLIEDNIPPAELGVDQVYNLEFEINRPALLRIYGSSGLE